MLFDREWNFCDNTPAALDSLHPYPAKFIREIPEKILKGLVPDKNLYVYDPFCGSGTTLVVAQEAGYKALGVDLNPIACLISRVKINRFEKPDGFEFKKFLSSAASNVDYSETVDIKNIEHWFQPHIVSEIASIRRAIAALKNKNLTDVLNLALSSIIVRASNQDSDTRYAAVQKDIPRNAVYDMFESAFGKITRALLSRHYNTPDSFVFEHNALDFTDPQFEKSVGIVITSPPYPNAYEYWLYHKYRMYWLGYDPIKVKELEIGARAHFFKKNRHDEHSFFVQMSAMFNNLRKYVVPNGYACFVVGRSKIHGKIIDNAEIIIRAAKDRSFKLVDMIERDIQSSRKSFNLSHANIKKETIVILKNGY